MPLPETQAQNPIEGSPEKIKIDALAKELGVFDVEYKYPDEDVEKTRAVFKCFLQRIKLDDKGSVTISAEDNDDISHLLNDITRVAFIPLLMPLVPDTLEKWKKIFFFDIVIVFLTLRGMELRKHLLEKLIEEKAFETDIKGVIPRLNDLEIFNTFSAMFHDRVKTMLKSQPNFQRLGEELLPLERWYDEQLKNASKGRGVGKGMLIMADKKYWRDTTIPVAKLFLDNPTILEMKDGELVSYIDRFLCHADYEYFDTLSAGIIIDKTRYIPRWKAWIRARKDLLLDGATETQKVFRRVFGISGLLLEDNILTEEARTRLPTDLIDAFSKMLPSEDGTIMRTRLEKALPLPTAGSPVVDALLSTVQAGTSASEKKPAPEALKLTEIPAPAMNFTIDEKTGVLMRPQGWKIPDGCRLEGFFWYLDDSQKKPLTPSEGHFGQKSLYDVEFLNEGGQEFYGNVCFSATLAAPQGSTFSSGTSSISSPELSFTKLQRIEAPSMKFIIDENTGVVRVPEVWSLPDGVTISWTACYKGKKGKELVQAKSFQINGGILDISYQEGGEEVYGRLYVTVTLTAPKGSIFSSGTSSISSPELSCLRKAPEVQATKPDAPQNIVATTAGFGEIVVFFDAPASNGGSPIMSYTVTASNGQQAKGLKSPITMKGLPGGKIYTFTVTAQNIRGESVSSSESNSAVATLKCATFDDTLAAWHMALSDDSNGLWYSVDEEGNIIVTLDDKLVGDGDNPAIDNLVYRTITIDSKGMFDIGDVLGEEISASLRAYAGKIRQDIFEKEVKRIEREKQNTIYHALQDTLHPCMEVLRGLAGTELATEKLNGTTLSQIFCEKGVPMTNTVVRKEEKPDYKNILTLNFTGRDVTVTYCDGKVIFSGSGYTEGSEGTQRAYHDFREVISELGAFLFLTESQKSRRLRRLREQRETLVGSFKNILTSTKKTMTAQLIAVSDAMLVPSCTGDSVAHVGFPPDGSPEVRYVVVTPETLEKEYAKLRENIHGSGAASKNKSISIVCLVRTGHIHINGDTGGDKKPYNTETVAANIESLRNSPQGRMLLWDRILASNGGTGTKIINGALEALEAVKSLYDDTLPTDEDTREEFIDDYLDELCDKGILISYVRFSAVTIKEVRAALEAGESSAIAD